MSYQRCAYKAYNMLFHQICKTQRDGCSVFFRFSSRPGDAKRRTTETPTEQQRPCRQRQLVTWHDTSQTHQKKSENWEIDWKRVVFFVWRLDGNTPFVHRSFLHWEHSSTTPRNPHLSEFIEKGGPAVECDINQFVWSFFQELCLKRFEKCFKKMSPQVDTNVCDTLFYRSKHTRKKPCRKWPSCCFEAKGGIQPHGGLWRTTCTSACWRSCSDSVGRSLGASKSPICHLWLSLYPSF